MTEVIRLMSDRPANSAFIPARTIGDRPRFPANDVVCPGFVADYLETLEEIAQEGKEDFQHAGDCEYHYIPYLNERPEWIHALAGLVLENLQGWLASTMQRNWSKAAYAHWQWVQKFNHRFTKQKKEFI